MASIMFYVVLSIMGRRPYRRLAAQRQSELAARLASVSLPVLGEFVRLTRGLGLVGVYERRSTAGAGL